MINLEKVSEGIDYEIVPNVEVEDRWAVQIIRGKYKGLGMVFDDIQINGKTGQLSFALSVIDIVQDDIVNSDNPDIQKFAGDIIEDIIKNGIASGAVQLNGEDSDQ